MAGSIGRALSGWPRLKGVGSAGNVLVLAPHMDDESIGPGGCIRLHAQAGAHVCVAFMTDGAAAGDSGTRKAEAAQACRILGAERVVFLDMVESDDRWDGAEEALATLMNELEPELAYVPSELDRHPDHARSARVFASAARKTLAAAPEQGRDDGFTVREYEVWSPLEPDILVRIDGAMEAKIDAIRCYGSQLSYLKYDELALSLSKYRACFAPLSGVGYAEAFTETEIRAYLGRAAVVRKEET